MTDIGKATAVFFAGLYEKTKNHVQMVSDGKKIRTYEFDNKTYDMNTFFADGYAGIFAEKNLHNLAWMYNGVNKR